MRKAEEERAAIEEAARLAREREAEAERIRKEAEEAARKAEKEKAAKNCKPTFNISKFAAWRGETIDVSWNCLPEG